MDKIRFNSVHYLLEDSAKTTFNPSSFQAILRQIEKDTNAED